MLDDTLLLTVYGLMVVIMTSCAHCHTIIHIQSYTYKHAMALHNGKRTRARNYNRYLHRNPPEADQVSAPEPSGTATGICSGNLRDLNKVSTSEPSGTSPGISTNMNWYKGNHVGWHAATNCIWSCACHHDIMCTLSNHHTHTIIQIQSIHIQPCNDAAHRYVTHSHEK